MGKYVFSRCVLVVSLVLFIFLIGCSSSETAIDDTEDSDGSTGAMQPEVKQISQEDSQSITEDYIVKSSLYINNEGKNLQLVETLQMRCPSCWTFIFEFDVKSSSIPDRTTGLQISVPINQGDINDDYVEIIQVPLDEPIDSVETLGKTVDILELDPQACADNGFVWCDLKTKCIEEWQEECDDPIMVDPDECIMLGGRSSEGADIGCAEDEFSAGQIIDEDGTNLCCIKN